jgi:hypothetical protein
MLMVIVFGCFAAARSANVEPTATKPLGEAGPLRPVLV